MSQDTLAIPQVAVAAAGRALQFTIAELSRSLKLMDQNHPAKDRVETEMLEMQDANKALFSAIPFCPEVIPALQHQLNRAQSTTEELQARLIERTEQSMATARRDAQTIRELMYALGQIKDANDCSEILNPSLTMLRTYAMAQSAITRAGRLPTPSTSESPRGA